MKISHAPWMTQLYQVCSVELPRIHSSISYTSPFVAAAFSVMVIIIVRFVVVVSLQTRYEQYCIERLAAS